MSFNGILEVDNKKHRVLNFNIRISQRVDETGRPNSNPAGGMFVITLESTENSDFLDWAISPDMTKSGKIVFQRRDNDTSLRSYEFKEAYCIDFVEDFSAESSTSMKFRIVISAKSVKSGIAELTKNWDKL
jgi:hypothetical protein